MMVSMWSTPLQAVRCVIVSHFLFIVELTTTRRRGDNRYDERRRRVCPWRVLLPPHYKSSHFGIFSTFTFRFVPFLLALTWLQVSQRFLFRASHYDWIDVTNYFCAKLLLMQHTYLAMKTATNHADRYISDHICRVIRCRKRVTGCSWRCHIAHCFSVI